MKSPLTKAASLRVLVAALVAVSACRKDDSGSRGSDSSLALDLALAGQQTAQQPTFQDTTVAPAAEPAPTKTEPRVIEREPAPAPRRPAPAPQPAPEPQRTAQVPPPQPAPITALPAPVSAPTTGPAAAAGQIGAGINFGLTSGSKVCSGTNMPGDKIVATLNEAVTGTNGVVLPAGSNVVLEVASVVAGANADAAQVAFRVRSVVVNDRTYTVDANVTPMTPLEKSKVANTDANADKKKVIGGAIAGAILGQMIGHNTRGTVIGAAAGAAAGAAVAKSGERWQACLPAGASLRLTLNAPLVISS